VGGEFRFSEHDGADRAIILGSPLYEYRFKKVE